MQHCPGSTPGITHMLWVPNRSSICGELRIVVDQSAESVVASQAKGRVVMRP